MADNLLADAATSIGRPRRGRRFLLLLAGNFAALLVLLLLLELVGRVCVWFWDIPTQSRPEPFQGFGQTDPVLWWTLQPNLDMDWEGVRVRTTHLGFRDDRAELPSDTTRIFCLGDSTTFGWHMPPDEMYTAVTERLLCEHADRPMTVVSAGVPGYTSYQCLVQFRQRILPLRPKVVSILASNNECRARSMGDRERGKRLARTLALHDVLGFSHLWVLLSRAPESLQRGWELEPPSGRPANNPNEYRQNILELLQLAREHDCQVVVMDVPLRLRFEPTWKRYDQPTKEVASLLRRAQQARLAGESAERQVAILQDAVQLEPNQFTAHWRLAQLYVELGRTQDADEQFRLARECDLHPETAKPSYNHVLDELCQAESVPFVDLNRRFAESGLPDDQLFLDHCHPTPAGQRIIAEALAAQVQQIQDRGL